MTLSRSRALPLAVALLAAAPARADDPERPAGSAPDAPPSTEAPPSPSPSTPADASDRDSTRPAPGEDTWLDAGHSALQRWLFAPAFRLDRFFSDEREIEPERETSFLRWRSEVFVAGDRSRPAFTTGIRATLQLPWLNQRMRRLRIVLAGETRDAVSALFPRSPAPNGAPATQSPDDEAIGSGDAGLRFYLIDSLFAHADLGGGFLVQLPPGMYGQLRLRWAMPVGTLFLARTALIGFWRSDEKFGTSASVDFERPILGRRLMARLSGGAMLSQRSDGVEWSSELAAIAPFPPRSAAQVGFAVTGATRANVAATNPVTGLSAISPVPTLSRSRLYARLRRDVYRSWLFLELEPEVAWPWSPDRGRYATWGFTFRFEVQFQARAPARPSGSAPAPIAKPDPDEPPDPAEAPAPPDRRS